MTDLIPGAAGAAPAAAPVDPDLVVSLDGVGVRRSGTALLQDLTWRVELDERWVVLGSNGAGKTTLLNLAAGRLHPTTGVAHVLGERIGRTDVNELRTRIGLTTAALAERLPADEQVSDVVVTAAWSVVGRWRESYDARRRGAGAGPARANSASVASPNAVTAPSPRVSASGCRSPVP